MIKNYHPLFNSQIKRHTMQYIILTLSLAVFIISCGQNDNTQKEFELKERELALKEKEFELKEKNSKPDTSAQTANTIQTASSSKPEEIVSNINTEIQRINSLSLTKKTFKLKDGVCESFNGFTIDYFMYNNEIVKITTLQDYAEQEGGAESMMYLTKEKYIYYYQEGKFIFNHQVLEVAMGEPGGKFEPTKSEFRRYAKNDKIIHVQGDKSISKFGKKELTPSSKEYKILNAYTTKNFATALCE